MVRVYHLTDKQVGEVIDYSQTLNKDFDLRTIKGDLDEKSIRSSRVMYYLGKKVNISEFENISRN